MIWIIEAKARAAHVTHISFGALDVEVDVHFFSCDSPSPSSSKDEYRIWLKSNLRSFLCKMNVDETIRTHTKNRSNKIYTRECSLSFARKTSANNALRNGWKRAKSANNIDPEQWWWTDYLFFIGLTIPFAYYISSLLWKMHPKFTVAQYIYLFVIISDGTFLEKMIILDSHRKSV